MLEQQQQCQACMLEQQQQQGCACWPLPLPAGNSKGTSRHAAGYVSWCASSTGMSLLASACIACWAARATCYLEGSKIKHRWLRKPLQQPRLWIV
jgi:hypothetical protein